MEEKETQNFPSRRGRVVLIVLLVIMLAVPVGKGIYKFIQRQQRINELEKLPGYLVCESNDEFYYMLNISRSDDSLLLLEEFVSSEFIAQHHQIGKYSEKLPSTIVLNILLPNEELHYGFEKTWDEILYDDLVYNYYSMIEGATEYIIYIEASDTCLAECEVKVKTDHGLFETIDVD
jgi:hypothetical protein